MCNFNGNGYMQAYDLCLDIYKDTGENIDKTKEVLLKKLATAHPNVKSHILRPIAARLVLIASGDLAA